MNQDTENNTLSKQGLESKNNKTPSIQDIFEIATKISVLFAGLIYVCGFLALNAHFYQYGIVDFGLASSDYLVVGSLFILYIAVYGVSGGRSIVLGKTWMLQQIDLLNSVKPRSINSFVAFIHSFLDVIFLHCLSAAFFSVYAFGQYESFMFYLVLITAFLIKYPLEAFGNLDLKYPLFFLIFDITIKVVAIWAFFNFSVSTEMIHVFITFAGFSVYINFVLDSFERYKINRDRILYTVILSTIFFLASAVHFGAVVYGDISKKIGGGQSIPVEISVSENIIKSLGIEQNKTLHGDFIYSSKDNIYIQFGSGTHVLPRQSVHWLKFKEHEDKNTSFIRATRDTV